MEENQNTEPVKHYIFHGDVYLDNRMIEFRYRSLIPARNLDNAKFLLKHKYCSYSGLNPEANISFKGEWTERDV